MAELAKSNRPSLVKPRSSWAITSKTSPTNPIEPLTKSTHPGGQPFVKDTVKPPPKPWHQWMSSRTFAAFSKFHLNTSKSTFMKVVHHVEGHNFHVEWHFKFWVEIGGKLDQPTVPPVSWNRATFKVGTAFLPNTSRKTLDGLYKSCRG